MARKKLTPEVLEFFKKQGAKGGKIGGKIGGKRSLETMTAEERRERARIAAVKSAEVRAKKAAAKKRAPARANVLNARTDLP